MIVARTYRTLSLSLPPGAVEDLAKVGKKTGRTGARVAAEIVLHQIARPVTPENRQSSWCCRSSVVPARGQLVLPEGSFGERRWIPAVVLLCNACGKQMHGREYEGWIADE